MEKAKNNAKNLSVPVGFWPSIFMFLILICLVVSMTVGLKTTPHVPLLIATVLAAAVGAFHHFSWNEMLEGITGAITAALPAMLIIMSIGLLIAAWMAGGIHMGRNTVVIAKNNAKNLSVPVGFLHLFRMDKPAHIYPNPRYRKKHTQKWGFCARKEARSHRRRFPGGYRHAKRPQNTLRQACLLTYKGSTV